MNAAVVTADLSGFVADMRTAADANDLPTLGRMVARYSGSDPVETGEPECDVADMVEYLTDCVRHDCYTFGIHCSAVGIGCD